METFLGKIKDRISVNFDLEKSSIDIEKKRVDVQIRKEQIPSILRYIKENMNFRHLMHASVVDWLEEGKFEVIFMLWAPKEKIRVFVRTKLDRENPVMENLDMIWPQLNTYEREFKEMYGIEFTGLVAPEEFILEDWDGPPPMRRDFDTEAYAKDVFSERIGREDAQDVRETIAKRSGEVIPDFAKKHSR